MHDESRYYFNSEEHDEAKELSDEMYRSFTRFECALSSGDGVRYTRAEFLDHAIYRDQGAQVLSKKDIRNHSEPFDLSRSESPVHWSLKTSGTSGQPLEVIYSSYFQFTNLYQALARTAWIHGWRTRERLATISGVFLTDNSIYQPARYLDPTGIGGELRILPVLEGEFDSTVREIVRVKANVLSTKPNLLRIFMEACSRAQEIPKLQLILTSGAMLPQDLRIKAEKFFRCPVTSSYNTSEIGFVGAECAHQFMHIDISWHQAEVLKANGEISDSGEGELLISSKANDCMPLFRYRTGDEVKLVTGKCTCGLAGARLEELKGRSVPVFDLGKGEKFSPTRWMKFFEHFGEVEEYQVKQIAERSFLVRIELKEGRDLGPQIIQKAADYFNSTLPSVEFIFEKARFQDKHIRFIARDI